MATCSGAPNLGLPSTLLLSDISPVLPTNNCSINFSKNFWFLHGNQQPPRSTSSSATWIEGQREVYPLYVGSSASRPAPLQRQREVLVWASMTQNINPIFPAQVSKVQSGLEGSPQAVHKVHHVFCRGPLHKVHRELWTTCWATISLSLNWTKKILLNKPIRNVIPGLRCSSPKIFSLFSLFGIEASLPGRTQQHYISYDNIDKATLISMSPAPQPVPESTRESRL